MRKNQSFILAFLLLLLFFGSILAMSSPGFQLSWFVPLTSGGGGHASSAAYSADVTLGQTAVQGAASSSYEIDMGYWLGAEGSYQLYLPLIVK